MRLSPRQGLLSGAFSLLLLSLLGCEQLSVPQMEFEQAPLPHMPISVNLEFDESVRNARLQTAACGMPWEGHLGHTLATSFLKTSTQSFQRVTMGEPSGTPQAAKSDDSDLTIQVSVINQALEASTALGEEDTYSARLNVELRAIVLDPQGNPIGQTPLTYSERVNIWTPALLSGRGSCETGRLVEAMVAAAEDLARQMVVAVATWAGPPPTQTAAAPVFGGTHLPVQPGQGGPSPVSLKATLLDENDNQILEGGEKVGIRLDATNIDARPMPPSSVVLSGTNVILDAFSKSLTSPAQIGALQPGETKGTMIWGQMPASVEPQRGELTISVVTSGAATSQTLVAAIRPRSVGGSAQPTLRPTAKLLQPGMASRPSTAVNRYAIVIGLDRYRDPWPQAQGTSSAGLGRIPRFLKGAARLPDDHIVFLHNEHATKADMVDAVLKWLPDRINDESVLLFYIFGHTIADPQTGEIFLLPYEGTPSSPQRRLVSLHALQGTLKRFNAKLSLLLVETPLAGQNGSARTSDRQRIAPLDWRGVVDGARPGQAVRLVQLVDSGGGRKKAGRLLASLRRTADKNRDGRVTLGEFLDDLRGKATVYPSLPANAPERQIALTGP